MSLQVTWSRIFPLTHNDIINNTREQAGIYRLSFRNSEDGRTVFYVGQTKEMQTRLLQHMEDSESNPCIRSTVNEKECFFRFAYVSEQNNRDCSESFLYQYYNRPNCNIQEPQATPCTINID